MAQHEPEPHFFPEIRRARVERLTIYEVSESELDILEKGSPDSIYLNVAIALLSAAVSLTATLLTSKVESSAAFVVFVVITVVGFVGGLVLLLLWSRSRKSVASCARTVRNRLPPEGVAKPLDSGGA
jgi:hypothetical protein